MIIAFPRLEWLPSDRWGVEVAIKDAEEFHIDKEEKNE